MKNIILIIGARPNFMKAFPVYEALKEDFKLTLIHTGQHFDEKMSKVFFDELKFPHPDIHLSLTKKTKAGDFDNKLYVNNKDFLKDKDKAIKELSDYKGDMGQLGEIRDKLKIEFKKLKPDLLIVFGDVTSTLAAGLSAKLLDIELAHVESGLRSGDMAMPEEVNRILTDHITTYYFVTEQSGVDNLKKINKTENVYLVGNTMIDTQKKYLQQALDTKYHESLKVKPKEYVLITLHRPSNVDDLDKLKEIFDDFEKLSKTETLVYPIHPRTKNNLKKLGYLQKVVDNKNIILDEPLGYLEFTCLMAKCKYLVTDSGGLQEESTALDIPCFTLRENTERPSTLIENNGTNQLISKISDIKLKKCKGSMKLWDGESSKEIKCVLSSKFNEYKYKNKFIIGSGWFADINKKTTIGKQLSKHQDNYGGVAGRNSFFSKYWLSHILKQSILPERIFILDADSPDKIDINIKNHSLVDISKQIKNYGHGALCSKDNILCGWGRGFIYGATQAYLNECDYIYVEQDLLIFGEYFIENVLVDLYTSNKQICYLTGEETPQKLQQSFIIVKNTYLPKLITGLINETNHTQSEELKFYNLTETDIMWCKYKGGRQRNNLNKENYCLQHMTSDEIDKLKKENKLINLFD
tara:strand:+ start:253 stop:2166 length:1914 start_codon:yes stop_codon:yes gene_type:complete